VLLRTLQRSDDPPTSVRKRLDVRQIGGVSRNLYVRLRVPYVRKCSYYSVRKSRNEAHRAKRTPLGSPNRR
jgi:hypothetical protein